MLLVLAALPLLFQGRYLTTVFISALLLFVLAAIFDFMLGYVNIVNFGFAGFLAAGAYTSALLYTHYGISPWLGLLAGGGMAALMGLVTGALTLRLQGIYVGLATLFVAELLRSTVANARDFTRGFSGLSTTTFPGILGAHFERSNPVPYYYLLLALVSLIYLGLTWIVHSRSGLAFRSIREDEVAAAVLGIDVVKYKMFNFAIASFCAGIIGAWYAHYIGVLVPSAEEFGVPRTVEILTVAYVGGRGTLWGSLKGVVANDGQGSTPWSPARRGQRVPTSRAVKPNRGTRALCASTGGYLLPVGRLRTERCRRDEPALSCKKPHAKAYGRTAMRISPIVITHSVRP
jgi:branched-chain amino acid transport system permease protein